MADTIAYQIFQITKNTFEEEGFENPKHNFFALESVPGSGKTTSLIDYSAYIFSHGITKNKYQTYKVSDGKERIIPAGEVNKWHLIKTFGLKEGEKYFNLKTQNKKDFFPSFNNKNVLIVVFNSSIKKEIEYKVKKHPILKEPFEKGLITIRTSHSLLFELTKTLDIIPVEKDENGEYAIDGIVTDFSKSDFYLNDVLKSFELLKKIKPFNMLFAKTGEKDKFAFASLMLDFIKVYYNTDIVVENPKELNVLFEKVNKKNKDDFSAEKEILKFFSFLNLKNQKENFAQKIIVSFLRAFKKTIEEGKIKVGHSFYYKEAFLHAIKDTLILKKLFSINNTGKMFYDVIIIDEAQDLTSVMARLLTEHYKQNISEILIVGDPKQAIYAFSERINAFNVFKDELKEEIKEFVNPFTYRIPQKICDYINEECRKMNIYDEKTKLIAKNKKEIVNVVENDFNVYDIILNALKNNEKTAVIGRTNASILIAYLNFYLQFKEKDLLKYIKINSKLKNQFKKLAKEGLSAIDDKKIKEKLQVVLGKKNPTFKDILTDEDAQRRLPSYIIKFASLLEETNPEEIIKALEYRTSSKANVEFLTAHTSKGLEFENVIVLSDVYESALNGDENEKFLYYVALTRTQKNLYVKKNIQKAKPKLSFDLDLNDILNLSIPKKIKQ